MKKLIIIAFTLFLSAQSDAQVNFMFIPELHGRSVDGLGSFQVQYAGTTSMSGRVYVNVLDGRTGRIVVTVMTPIFSLTPGNTNFSRALFSNSSFRFASDPVGMLANQTRNFAPGEYSYCFRFVPQDKTLNEYETCIDGEIQPLVPLSLISPSHLDTICNKRPVLSWQPPLPYTRSMRFRLLLTEKGDDDRIEALNTKTPLLLLDNITTASINYPPVNPELKEGHTYVWQVVAYEGGVIISRSEIWEFTVQCKEVLPPVTVDSYRELKLRLNGNYYIANGVMRFSFRNDYNANTLKYELLDLVEGRRRVGDVPDIKLTRGLNNVDIDLRELDLTPGREYLLKVYPFNEPSIEVRFVFKDDSL